MPVFTLWLSLLGFETEREETENLRHRDIKTYQHTLRNVQTQTYGDTGSSSYLSCKCVEEQSHSHRHWSPVHARGGRKRGREGGREGGRGGKRKMLIVAFLT